jgi:hypothetical protein
MLENPEQLKNEELKKLSGIATDMQLDAKLRTQAIELIANLGNHEALLALLSLAANTQLSVNERDLALKRSRDIVKSNR